MLLIAARYPASWSHSWLPGHQATADTNGSDAPATGTAVGARKPHALLRVVPCAATSAAQVTSGAGPLVVDVAAGIGGRGPLEAVPQHGLGDAVGVDDDLVRLGTRRDVRGGHGEPHKVARVLVALVRPHALQAQPQGAPCDARVGENNSDFIPCAASSIALPLGPTSDDRRLHSFSVESVEALRT